MSVNARVSVTSAIKELNYRVTAADTAAATGLSLHDARVQLNRLAWVSRGTLEVSRGGDVIYGFDRSFESAEETTAWRKALAESLSMLWAVVFYVIRISFGVLLIASFVTIAIVFLIALVFILLGIDASDGQLDGDLPDNELDFEFFDFADLGVFFSWAVFFDQQTPTSQSNKYLGMSIDSPDRGFFYNCYSFLFGDGDPNSDIAEQRWRVLAEVIRKGNGVLTGDQLAAYSLGRNSEHADALEVLVRFDGVPEVTESGNLVYVFPDLQVSAHKAGLVEAPPFLEEKYWKFSNLPVSRLYWVFFFAGANLCGAYALNNHVSWFLPLQPFAQQVHLMMVYAAFFMGLPILRQLLNTGRNAWIETRNRMRAASAEKLSAPGVRDRLIEAQQFARKRVVLSAADIHYSTDKDLLEQEFDWFSEKSKS